MNRDDIAADRAVIDAATPGEWVIDARPGWATWCIEAPASDGHPDYTRTVSDRATEADAAFIAAARTGWPRALDALKAAQAEVERLRRVVAGGTEGGAYQPRMMGLTRAEVADLKAEVERLRNWKAEALTVLAGWEDVYEALGRPGPLGASKAFAALVEVKSLREREARVRAVCDAEWDWKAGRSLHAALRAAIDGEA